MMAMATSLHRLALPFAPAGVEVCVMPLQASEDEMLASLPAEKAQRLRDETHARFQSAHRRKEWLASRVLLHQVCPAAEIVYLPTGRPQLSGPDSAQPLPCISISHSHDWAALAHAEQTLGIDIEVWGPRALRLLDRYVNEEEHQVFEQQTDCSAEQRAVLFWTIKEAAYKFYDNAALSLIDLTIADLRQTVPNLWTGHISALHHTPIYIYAYAREAFALTICLEK